MSLSRILIVEDEQLVATDLQEILEELGYEVPEPLESGEEAIRQAESLLPDLVLMDIRLAGGMDGIQASEQIQLRLQIPVVYLTANTDPSTLSRVQASNPFGYIPKPYNKNTLATTIEIALSRHRKETQIQQNLITLEEEIQRQVNQLAIASHELRTPLSVIQFSLGVLERQGEQLPLEKKQKHFQKIQEAVDSLKLLLEDLLLLENMNSEKLEFSPTPINIASFCEEQIEVWQFTSDNQHYFTYSFQGETPIVCLDEKLLRHLLNNLLSNAVKYSSPSSTISLVVSCFDTFVQILLTDQGMGIPDVALQRLFEPFYRAQNVKNLPGTGLGLAIAKRCVDLHNGQITISSKVGQGTSVTVTLPR
jgi:signal transduction histidine kinase